MNDSTGDRDHLLDMLSGHTEGSDRKPGHQLTQGTASRFDGIRRLYPRLYLHLDRLVDYAIALTSSGSRQSSGIWITTRAILVSSFCSIILAASSVFADQPVSVDEAVAAVKKAGGNAEFRQSLSVEISADFDNSNEVQARLFKERVAAAVQTLIHLQGVPVIMDLTGEAIDDALFEILSNVSSIVELHICAASLSDAGLSKIENLKSLEELELLESKAITGRGFQCLSTLPRLKRLVLWGIPVSDDAMKFVGASKHLNDVEISSSQVSDIGLGHLGGLSNLSKLVLEHNDEIRGEGFARFPVDSHLSTLQIDEPVTNIGMTNICKLANIRTLSIAHSSVNHEGLAALSSLRKLQDLAFNENDGIDDTALGHLKGLANLRRLELSEGRLTDRVLDCIGGLESLVKLRLRNMSVSDASIKKFLANHPGVTVEKILVP